MKFKGYDLRNVPTSTGRADMIIRIIKNALYLPNAYNFDMGVLLFPNSQFLADLASIHNIDNQECKGFLITSRSPYFKNEKFRIQSEHEMLKALYNSFSNLPQLDADSLFYKCIQMDFYESVAYFIQKGVKGYCLQEEGGNIDSYYEDLVLNQHKFFVILGDQKGFDDVHFDLLPAEIVTISLGKTSYLGSTIITLFKWWTWEKSHLINNP